MGVKLNTINSHSQVTPDLAAFVSKRVKTEKI